MTAVLCDRVRACREGAKRLHETTSEGEVNDSCVVLEDNWRPRV